MKKLSTFIAAAAMLLTAGSAFAQLGIGASNDGLVVRYAINDDMQAGINLGLAQFGPKDGDSSMTIDADIVFFSGASSLSGAPGRIEVHLIIVQGPGRGQRIVLGSEPIHIGRDPSNDLIVDDTRASRKHAQVIPSGDDIDAGRQPAHAALKIVRGNICI